MNTNSIKISKNEFNEYFGAAAYVGTDLYYADWHFNGLYKVENEEIEPKYLRHFGDDLNITITYEYAFAKDECVWFIPGYSDTDIAIYNIKKDKMEYLPIPKCENESGLKLFSNFFVVDNTLWLAPCSHDTIFKVDLKNRLIVEFSLNIDKKNFNGKNFVFCGAVFVNNKIVMCPWNYDYIVCFDCENQICYHSKISFPRLVYRNILVINEMIYLVGRNNNEDILIYDLDFNKIGAIRMPDHLSGISSCIFSYNERIYCMPLKGNEIIIVDTKTNLVDTMNIIYEDHSLVEDADFNEARKLGEVYLLPSGNNNIANMTFNGEFHQLNICKKEDNFLKVLIREMELNNI